MEWNKIFKKRPGNWGYLCLDEKILLKRTRKFKFNINSVVQNWYTKLI